MKSYLLLVGDKDGLRDGNVKVAKVERPPIVPVVGYRGFSGTKASPDQEFVNEMVERRSALKVSAIQLSKLAEISSSYVSMVEKGRRYASEETKVKIRKTLDDLENGLLEKPIYKTRKRTEPDPEFVKELIQRRQRLGITGVRLSEFAGFSKSYISLVETGRTDPSKEAKIKIREALDIFENKILTDLTNKIEDLTQNKDSE